MWIFKRTTTASTKPLQVAPPKTLPSHSSKGVLFNPELLCLIFQCLSPTELFFAARHVHPFWLLVISETKSLQDRINYRNLKRTWPPEPRMNPILQRAFPMFFQSYQWVDVFSFSPCIDSRDTSGQQMKGKYLSVETLSCPTAAFRSMPVLINLEKPIETINIVEERIRLGVRQRRGVLRIPTLSVVEADNDENKGLTMGLLIDLCLGWCAGDPQGRSFIVRWRRDTVERSLTEHKPVVPPGESIKVPDHGATLWTRLASFLIRPLAPVPANTGRVWRAISLYDCTLPRHAIGKSDTSLEIVFHNAVDCPDWFSDIPNRDMVVPEDWQAIDGKFGNLAEEVEYNYGIEQAPIICHSIRFPRNSMKWRWAPRCHCLHCMELEIKFPRQSFNVLDHRG